ncbi:MAG: hypothetical protein V1726_06340 [Methanobacteriota archaeon]
MVQSTRNHRNALHVASAGAFLLFSLISVMLLLICFVNSMGVGLLFLCVLCISFLGVLCTGVLLLLLVNQWREEKIVSKQKEAAVRTYYRYNKVFDGSSMDN